MTIFEYPNLSAGRAPRIAVAVAAVLIALGVAVAIATGGTSTPQSRTPVVAAGHAAPFHGGRLAVQLRARSGR